MSVKRKVYDLFVDDEHVDHISSGWPMGRILTQLRKENPNAMRLEVRLDESPNMSTFFLRRRGRFNEDVCI